MPANPAVLPSSSEWAAALQAGAGQINMNTGAWTPGVFAAGLKTQRLTVTVDGGWVIDGVPIPANLSPSLDTDGHALIIDQVRGREYDFFRLERKADGSWTAGAGVVFRLGGSGWWRPHPWGARASGAALGGGLIRARDVAGGVIRHALACAAPKWLIRKMTYGVAPPATTSDGWGPGNSIPMGTRFQLDPSLDLDTLGLEPGEKVVAKALQVYGLYIVDSSYGVACFAENRTFLPDQANPYPSSWDNGLSRTLLGKLRAIAPPRVVRWDSRLVYSQPHRPR